PLQEKMKVKRWADDVARGYSPLADESVAYSRDKLTPGDLKESLSIGPPDVLDEPYYHCAAAGQHFAANRWPERPAELKEVWTEYFYLMERLAAGLLRIFALAFNLSESYFEDKIDKHISVLRVLNYPDQPDEPSAGQLRAGEHSDYDSLTILCQQDRPGGLQVQNWQGEWVDVPVIDNSFVVNIGDMMMRWTNDRWISTMHRVVNPPRSKALGRRRLSIAFFHLPNYDTLVECLPSCCGPGHP